MKLKPVKLSSLLSQVKDKHSIQNENTYKQVTVSNTGTISLREEKMGIDIGTKNQFFIKKGQFIYSRLGLHTGAFGIVPDSLDGAVVTGDMPVFEINNSKVLTEFLILSLDGDFFRNQLNGLNKGVAQSRIRESILLNLKILLPETIKEQEEILSKYNEFKSNYDNLSEISSKNLDYVKNLKQSILGEAIEGKLTKSWREQNPGIEPASVLLEKIKAEKEELVKQKVLRKQEKLKEISKDEIPFEIPKTWSWCRLGFLSEISSGGTPNRGKLDYWENGKIPWLKSGELNDNKDINKSEEFINEIGLKNSSAKIFHKGTLLIALYGATAGKIGILGFDSTTNQAVCGISETKYINTMYLFYFFLGNREQILYDGMGAAQPNISQFYIKNKPIPLPPLEEQKEIVRIIDELTKFCDELENQTKKVVEKSEKLYKSFINNIGEYSEDEIKELLENSKSIEENIKETVTNNLSFKNFEEFVAYIESLQKKEEENIKTQDYNLKSNRMEISKILESSKKEAGKIEIMELLNLLKDNKYNEEKSYGIDPLNLWQFSKHKDSIEGFYDELKKLENEDKINQIKGDEMGDILIILK